MDNYLSQIREARIVSPEEVYPKNEQELISLREEPSDQNELPPANMDGDDSVLTINADFDYEGYQVVRREFFAHISEPSVTFSDYKVYVNAACLNKFVETEFVQVLVNQDSKILAIRPCQEDERDAFAWCSNRAGKRKPKQITCRLFFAKVISLMEWNPDYRYKLLGKVIHANNESLIVFDLSATEIYQRIFKEGQKPRSLRTPVFPEGWQHQFGLPFKEHQKSMQVNIFDGYAVYGIKEEKAQNSTEPETQDTQAGGENE